MQQLKQAVNDEYNNEHNKYTGNQTNMPANQYHPELEDVILVHVLKNLYTTISVLLL